MIILKTMGNYAKENVHVQQYLYKECSPTQIQTKNATWVGNIPQVHQ